jgi:hypothetical protein
VSRNSMYQAPYWLWTIWPELGFLNRVFLVVMGLLTAYSLALLAMMMKHRRQSARNANGPALAALRERCGTLRQIIGAAFYAFGILLFIDLQLAPMVGGDHNAFPAAAILSSFILHFAFAANVLCAFLFLHLVTWWVLAQAKSREQLLTD